MEEKPTNETNAAPRRAAARQAGSRGRSGARRSAGASASPASEGRVPRLLTRYRDEVVPTMITEFGYRVPLQAPRLQKVVLNVGMGEALTNANALTAVTAQFSAITGQRPVITKARKSIAGFKIRDGMNIGVMVTLRSHRMYDFVDRLVNAVLPRIRDFRGVPRGSFAGRGNYSMGIREQIIFPEIDYNQVDRIRGLQVTFVTSARTNEEAYRMLELMGMPFAREDDGR